MTTPISLTNTQYRLGYHIQAPSGWINDPNGFVYFKGYYHIFYQYHPYSADWGPMHWGHARSQDLVHWETLPIALTPGDPEDKDGCFSGSAIVKDDTLYLFYTGHHYYGDNDPEHFWQNQNMASSTDGIHFTKYAHNPVIASAPTDNTHHFRDPKVWEHQGRYYMILGSQGQNGRGRVILYRSTDLIEWSYQGVLDEGSDLVKEGFMWECPDFFHLAGHDFLLTSPQGIEATATRYLNLFQTGYFKGTYDYEQNHFEREAFQELDFGHDFYATQTTVAPDGRRLVFGWMAMWEAAFPEKADGWAGALTLPRELTVRDDRLCMQPVAELTALRLPDKAEKFTEAAAQNVATSLPKRQVEVDAVLRGLDQAAHFSLAFCNREGQPQITLTYDARKAQLRLENAFTKDSRYVESVALTDLTVRAFLDTSSLELFLADGRYVFTERLYSESLASMVLTTKEPLDWNGTVYPLKTSTLSF